ncbi:MAG: HAD family phosphatase [Candidatus Omnitrophica bacterium]|nr:HAD family phosphatase [Candidatus Omnitrophota bacterium]
MTSERAILFDLGKVLIDFDHNIAVGKIKRFCGMDEKSIYNLFFDSGITDKFERGVISPFDFFQEVKKMLNADMEYKEFVPIWNEIFTPHPGMIEVIESLKDNYPLYLVSNINEMHFKYLEEKFSGYFKYFSYMFLSYELGLRKPDARIYEYIIDYIKLSPKNITYTDDRPELIEAARKSGIDAFVFESTDAFIEELSRRNIKLDLALDGRK